MTRRPRAGEPAPDFVATTADGREVRLSDYRGRASVVLSFYPKDFTAGCTAQMCLYRDAHREIEELGAVLLAVSADDGDTHRRFARRHSLPFPLLSDPDRRIAAAYGAVRLGGLLPGASRVTFVIDTRGIVRRVAHHEFAVGRHLAAARDTLRMLREEGRTDGGGGVRPAG